MTEDKATPAGRATGHTFAAIVAFRFCVGCRAPAHARAEVRKTRESSAELDGEIARLKLIEDDFDRVKQRAEKEVAAAKRDVLKLLEEVRDVRETNEQIRPRGASNRGPGLQLPALHASVEKIQY